jgi:hypothetical protein
MVFLTRDSKHHRTYITGNGATTAGDSFYVAGNFIDPMYLACFDDSANMKWIALGDVNAPNGKAAVDEYGNVYITGGGTNTAQFNGTSFSSFMIDAEAPYIVKLDTNGTNVWATNGVTPIDIAWGTFITVANDTVGLWGGYSAPFLAWQGDTLPAAYYTPYIARFRSSNGALLSIDTLPCNQPTNAGDGGGFGGSTQCIAGDQYGNFYVGGNFSYLVNIPADTLTIYGGETDFFIAKFGTSNCDTPVITSAIRSSPKPRAVMVYPNPVTDELNITDVQQTTSYRIMNIAGVLLQQGQLQAGGNSIYMQNLTSGIYILEMTGPDGRRDIVKVVKE